MILLNFNPIVLIVTFPNECIIVLCSNESTMIDGGGIVEGMIHATFNGGLLGDVQGETGDLTTVQMTG